MSGVAPLEEPLATVAVALHDSRHYLRLAGRNGFLVLRLARLGRLCLLLPLLPLRHYLRLADSRRLSRLSPLLPLHCCDKFQQTNLSLVHAR